MAEKNSKSGVSEQILSLPKGGGAIKGLGEKFQPDLHTGTGNFSIPLSLPPGRNNFAPQLALAYSTGAGNGPFGLGWSLSIPNISRRTSKGIPVYTDDRDVFILSGAEDLVELERTQQGSRLQIRYRPRTEGLFARILHIMDTGTKENYWEVITQDGARSLYGNSGDSQLFADKNGVRKIFAWYLVSSQDTRGNNIRYFYKRDQGPARVEYHREYNQVYLQRIEYGNYIDSANQEKFLLQVDFDYGEYDDYEIESRLWKFRPDAFSAYRSGFEIRTARRCERILIRSLHPGVNAPSHLIQSYDLAYAQDDLSNVSLLAEVVHRGYATLREGGPAMAQYRHRQTNLYVKSFPPLSLKYSRFDPRSRKIVPLRFDCARPPEKSLADPDFELVDLYGNGLPDIVHTTTAGYYCWRNLGNGRFGAPHRLPNAPAGARFSDGGVQLADMEGNGSADFLVTEGPARGFYENHFAGAWEKFHPYAQSPSFNLKDPNVRLVDLDGDGVTDVLATYDHHFLYIKNQPNGNGHLHFADPVPISRKRGLENWPDVYFSHPENRVRLADMSGDGLQDMVLIHDGRIDYWPNLGHGRWGKRLTLGNGPHLPGRYDPRRVFLADINGDGLADLIYVGAESVHYWINQNGNTWSARQSIACSPPVTDADSIRIADIFGSGTGGILWSFDWSLSRQKNYQYLNFIGTVKPNLLVAAVNNLGAETHVQYVPSTQFYLHDEASGHPWITKLPFPVQVVEQVETIDRISHNRFVTRYAYHHGFFDGDEREFRGFGMVEQTDTQELAALNGGGLLTPATNIEAGSYVPPMLSKTWFHTGAYLEGYRISRLFEKEYYRELELNDKQAEALLLPDTVFPTEIRLGKGKRAPHNLPPEEKREAARTLRGSVLRQEVYALDKTAQAKHPYSVKEQNYTIELLNARRGNRNAVFFVHPRSSIDFHYERKLFAVGGKNLPDPRVTQAFTLAVDDYGNVLQTAAVGYGRRHDDPDILLTKADKDQQKKIWITSTENDYTNGVSEKDAWHGPMICETRSYEILQAVPDARDTWITNLFGFEEIAKKIQQAADGNHDLPYEDVGASAALPGHPYRRLIERERVYYRKNDLSAALKLGELESMALPFETYKLAFTPGLLKQVFQPRAVITDTMLSADGGYVDLDKDKNWWIPSGKVFYSPKKTDAAARELAFAKRHFFLPWRTENPFGQSTWLRYDEFDLLILETEGALNNKITAGERDRQGNITNNNNYRVFQPALITDPNGNRSAVVFDALGMVTGTAVMGKTGEKKGDLLDHFWPDLDETTLQAQLNDPLKDPWTALSRASSRLIYDLFAYRRTQNNPQPQPSVVCAFVRETHDADLKTGEKTKIQHQFSYSDGFGREIQKKIQAEPGPLAEGGPEVSPRWVGSGWTIFNNKGKPVRQYEPFFSATHHFEFGVITGVSPMLFYDPAERVIVTLHPNHTYDKVVFDPWQRTTYDVNDTCAPRNRQTSDPRTDPDIGGYVAEYFKTQAASWQTWHTQRIGGAMGTHERDAAGRAAAHADTPATTFFDSLGRPFLAVEHNRFVRNGAVMEEKYLTRTHQDIEGNQREVIDAKGRLVMRYAYDLLGHVIHQSSMEAGARWMLNDVAGNPSYSWDSRGHRFWYKYDELRRPTEQWVRGTDPHHSDTRTLSNDILFEKITYGEGVLNAIGLNLNTRVYQQFDGAGRVTHEAFDFKGNLLNSSRTLMEKYSEIPNWKQKPKMIPEIFNSSIRYDALNRPIQIIAPHSSLPGKKLNVIQPKYNEANLLEGIHVWLKEITAPADLLTPTPTTFQPVKNMDYNAKGQRTQIQYGNDVQTIYEYDKETFRLIHLFTQRPRRNFPKDCPGRPDPYCGVQNLYYTYDPVGNITHIRDDAQQTVFFKNKCVQPENDYTYDAVYRLIEATGREHLGQHLPAPPSHNDYPRENLPHPGDCNAMGQYTQKYIYDEVGNFMTMAHTSHSNNKANWTRNYQYLEGSQLEPGKYSNRLSSTTVLGRRESYSPNQDSYDAHGNMLRLPHLSRITWDFQDQLLATSQQVTNSGPGETTYYVYDTGGQRVRKITETRPGRSKNERIYLGSFEIYREHIPSKPLERETLYIMDGEQRVALVETLTTGQSQGPRQLIRYQHGNHLGSASVELDQAGEIISYEEYFPYGSTSYKAMNSKIETPKRYRYSGQERDEESGLYYYGARYYISWLGRWVSIDPLQMDQKSEENEGSPLSIENPQNSKQFIFNENNPIKYTDENGRAPQKFNLGQFFRRVDFGARFLYNIYAAIFPSESIKPKDPLAEVKKREEHLTKPKRNPKRKWSGPSPPDPSEPNLQRVSNRSSWPIVRKLGKPRPYYSGGNNPPLNKFRSGSQIATLAQILNMVIDLCKHKDEVESMAEKGVLVRGNLFEITDKKLLKQWLDSLPSGTYITGTSDLTSVLGIQWTSDNTSNNMGTELMAWYKDEKGVWHWAYHPNRAPEGVVDSVELNELNNRGYGYHDPSWELITPKKGFEESFEEIERR